MVECNAKWREGKSEEKSGLCWQGVWKHGRVTDRQRPHGNGRSSEADTHGHLRMILGIPEARWGWEGPPRLSQALIGSRGPGSGLHRLPGGCGVGCRAHPGVTSIFQGRHTGVQTPCRSSRSPRGSTDVGTEI